MHGLEAVARIGQRAADDHAHGVIEIGFFQFVFDRDGRDRTAAFGGRAALRCRNVSLKNQVLGSARNGRENAGDF